jgi:hypothetical protein
MVALPDKMTDEGLEARVLLAECKGPAFPKYKLEDATTCMKYMDLVLWHRVSKPKLFGAKHGTLTSVVTAKGQYQGFHHYPNYSGGIKQNIQNILNIANSEKDGRSATYTAYVQLALDIANGDTLIPEPSPGMLAGWVTMNADPPKGSFKFFLTFAGIDFYYV